jgi:hypothetical protein
MLMKGASAIMWQYFGMADKKLIKSAGEHWTCSMLARSGWAAALTRDGVERTDVIGAHSDGALVSIQVKTTTTERNPKFMFGAKGCDPAKSDREWYVLVALPSNPDSAPRSFVVPRDHVAAAVWIRHQEWLTNPSVPAGKRNTGLALNRAEAWIFARYEQRWDLLLERTNKVPIMLPPRFREWATNPRVGLPTTHPWAAKLPKWDASETSASWKDWATAAK